MNTGIFLVIIGLIGVTVGIVSAIYAVDKVKEHDKTVLDMYRDCGKTMDVCNLILDNNSKILDVVETLQDRKETIKVKYFDNEIDKLEKINKGDLIDLRAAETVEMKAGDFKLIRLGVGMKLPEGYKANVYPRSSTYKNFGIILANSVGQIDNSYSGDNDEWRFPAIALRDTVIHKNDRICQFEIQKIQPDIEFEEVEHLDDVDRGAFGSTGKA